MKHIPTFESFIQESSLAYFNQDMAQMINHIKGGMGWIDPEYVEETFLGMQSEDGLFKGKSFSGLKNEIYKALITADLLYFADANDEEEKGKKVTSLSQI